jgi:uncharacterized protein YbjQ (UPF0145 family)
MLRESELIEKVVQDPTWKRIERLMPEAAAADADAVVAMLVGAGALVLAALLLA